MRLHSRPLLLSLLVCAPLFGQWKLSEEKPIAPAPLAPSPAYGAVSAASDGKDHLVVWAEVRSGMTCVVATRVSAAGEILDPNGIILQWESGGRKSVAWDEATGFYLVTLEVSDYERRYYAVSRTGTFARHPAPAKRWPRNDRGETITFGAAERDSDEMWFLDVTGRKTASMALPTAFGEPREATPAGDDWLLLFSGQGDSVIWARVNQERGLVKWLPVVPRTDEFATALDQTRFGIFRSVREMTPSGARLWRYYWTTVDENGVTASGSLWAQRDGDEPSLWVWAVGAAGGTFHFAWAEPSGRNVHLLAAAVRDGVEQSRTLVEESLRRADFWPSYTLDFASSATSAILAWGITSDYGRQDPIRFATFDRNGLRQPARDLSWRPARQDDPRGAAGARGTLIVWQDTEVATAIRGRFTPRPGVPGPVFDIATGVVAAPRAAVNGDVYVAAWADAGASRLYARRYDANGKPLDALPIVVADREALRDLAVVPQGDAFRVVWQDTSNEIRTARLSRAGEVGASAVVAVPAFDAKRQMSVSSNGDVVVVFWGDQSITDVPWRRMFTSRIAANGTAGVPVEIVVAEMITPVAAAGNDSLLVLWRIARASGGCITYQRYTLDGTRALSERQNLFCDNTPPTAQASWDGERWWIATSGSARLIHTIAADGTAGSTFEALAPDISAPYIFPIPHGLGVLYTRVAADAGRMRRGFLRTLADEPPPQRQRAVRK